MHPDFPRGLEAFAAGDHHEAVEVFSRILMSDSRNAEAYYYRGKAHLLLLHRPQAIADLNQAIRLTPSILDYRTTRAAELFKQKQYALCIDDCEFVLAREPQRADLIFLRGQCRWALGDSAAALADLTVAAALDPANTDIPRLKAAMLVELGQFEEIAKPPPGI